MAAKGGWTDQSPPASSSAGCAWGFDYPERDTLAAGALRAVLAVDRGLR